MDEAALARQLMLDLASGIRVLRDRDGLPLSEAQINERAANLAMAILGGYEIHALGIGPEWE